MATKLYTIESLLVGKNYRSVSRKIDGIIQEAEIAPEIWYGENTTAYRVRVRPTYDGKILREDFWATVAVRMEA